jgi:hypothetical protein
MIQEADARAAVRGYLGSDEFELDEFPEGWRVIRPIREGYRGAVTIAVERSSGTLLRFPSSIPPDRVSEEFAAVRADGRAVGQAGPASGASSSDNSGI